MIIVKYTKYRVVDQIPEHELEKVLNTYGEKGWKLAHIKYTKYTTCYTLVFELT